MSSLQTKYRTEILPRLSEKLGGRNIHAVPKLEKVVISMGLGKSVGERKRLEEAVEQLGLIAGQKARITRARRAISGFRLREGMEIGCAVTLRSRRMYEFIDRLVTIALPRVKDFRGLNAKSFDGRGNYAMGLKEHIVFPEIDYDKAESIVGMDVIVCTTAKTDEEARALLKAFNFPFRQ